MKTIHILMAFNDAVPDRGWYPVISTTTSQEMFETLRDKRYEDNAKGVVGMHYRTETCTLINR